MVLRVYAAICGAAILFAYSSAAIAKLGTVNVYSDARGKPANDYAHRHGNRGASPGTRHDACATSKDKRRCIPTIVGTASMYDPFQPGYDEGGIETASGELYDRMAWTAAIQTNLREAFGGIHYGKDYRPTYALVEIAEKRVIIKINDVGPLKPGRVIDFNEQTMRYFDPTLQRGIIHSVKVTPLPGDGWATGPING
jgi:peptidoglycan lytic transglycosylase